MTIIAVGYFLLSIVVLFLGTILLALFSGVLAGHESGNLHTGTAYLVAGLGSIPYLLWGWPSTFTILAVLTLWTLVGALLNKRDRDRDG